MQKGKCRSVFAVLAQPGSWSSWSQRDDESNFPHYKSPLCCSFHLPPSRSQPARTIGGGYEITTVATCTALLLLVDEAERRVALARPRYSC